MLSYIILEEILDEQEIVYLKIRMKNKINSIYVNKHDIVLDEKNGLIYFKKYLYFGKFSIQLRQIMDGADLFPCHKMPVTSHVCEQFGDCLAYENKFEIFKLEDIEDCVASDKKHISLYSDALKYIR